MGPVGRSGPLFPSARLPDNPVLWRGLMGPCWSSAQTLATFSSTYALTLTPPLVSRHLISHQRSHLRKWSSRSKGPLRSCPWNWTHGASVLPHTLVQHWLTKGRAPGKVPPSSYSPAPNVLSLPQSSASLFAMAANTAVGRGSSRTTNCRAQGRLLTRRVSTWCKAEMAWGNRI